MKQESEDQEKVFGRDHMHQGRSAPPGHDQMFQDDLGGEDELDDVFGGEAGRDYIQQEERSVCNYVQQGVMVVLDVHCPFCTFPKQQLTLGHF